MKKVCMLILAYTDYNYIKGDVLVYIGYNVYKI
jgi:hypothetical protein